MGITRAPGAPRVALIDLGTMSKHLFRVALAGAIACLLPGCGSQELLPAMRPLPKEAVMLLGKKGMKTETPIFVRIFKEESELEVWKVRDDGRFYHFKTYPICNWSGDVGPKERQGDKQAPEGFYSVTQQQMNPNSGFHLAFNLGYPNNYDRAHGRTGEFLMVHGKCKSAGCYAMTDALMEEIYALAREQFISGNESFQVHAFPFRMTPENLARHRKSKWYPFWMTLKEGYDYFETTRQLPEVAVCERRYLVNIKFVGNTATRIDPEGRCPPFERVRPEPFTPIGRQQIAERRVMAPGVKMRTLASAEASGDSGGSYTGTLSGLFKRSPQPASLGFSGSTGE
jgi:murein L,D-transpeptidase YafK